MKYGRINYLFPVPYYQLTRLVLLIAIAYTFSTFKGQAIRLKRQQEYMGLYGDVWIISQTFLSDWVAELMSKRGEDWQQSNPTRLYKASRRGDVKTVHRLQNLLR